MAIAKDAIEICSPDVRSMSSSLLLGVSESSYARLIKESVVPAGAETTTITSCPSFLYFKTLLATSFTLSASATEVPPYFCTINAMLIIDNTKLCVLSSPFSKFRFEWEPIPKIYHNIIYYFSNKFNISSKIFM